MPGKRNRGRARRGNAAVELAVTLPLMVSIVFGSVETCQLIHVRQVVESAAYECALVAVDSEATDADVQRRMSDILDQRGVNAGSLTTTPASVEGIPRGTRITVSVSAPFADNTWVPVKFVSQPNIESRCVMLKEF